MTILLNNPMKLIRDNRTVYAYLNVLYFGVLLGFMAVGALYPALHDSLLEAVENDINGSAVANAYVRGDLLSATCLTFGINLLAALVIMTLPSLVIPFFAIPFALYRAALWGILFTPIGPDAGSLIPHSLTLLVEGEAYVLVAFASYVHGRSFLLPGRDVFMSRWAGYKAGLAETARLYLLVAVVLLVGAVYEGFEVIYLVPRFV